MGMGHSAGYADTITEDGLRKIVGNLIDEFVRVVEETDTSTHKIPYMINDGVEDDDPSGQRVVNAWEAVAKAFLEYTGLEVCVVHHDSESEGDRYDEIDGLYYHVEGMYELSQKGRDLQFQLDKEHAVERKFFVTFG